MTGALGALGTAAAALWVVPGATDAFEGPKGIVWALVALALAVAGLVRHGGDGVAGNNVPAVSNVRSVPSPRSLAWLLLFWMALRTALAAWGGGREAALDAARPLAAWATPLLLFALAARLPWSDGGRRLLARTIASLGLAEAALMALQRLGWDPLFGDVTRAIAYAPGRMVGTVGYQNQAAEFLGVALCCVPAAWRNRWARAGAAAALAAVLLLTANRGAMLGLAAVAVAAGAVWARRTRGRALRRWIPVAWLAMAALALAVPETRTRVAELAAPRQSEAVRTRAWMARVAVSLWRDHPVFGAGAGAYEREYVDRLGALLPRQKERPLLRSLVWAREAHCDPLQFGAEFGVFGLAVLAVFGAVLWRSRRRAGWNDSALAAVLFLTVCSLFSFSWQTALAAPVAALWLGAARSRPPSGGHLRFAPGGLLPLAAAALLLAAALAPSDVSRTSPAGIAMQADALLRDGRAEESLALWQRLVRSGLRHGDALHGESRALEALGRLAEAADVERTRFRRFAPEFTDAQLYRLCVLEMQLGRHGDAGNVARQFRQRCIVRADDAARWTPEWSNLLGAALLAAGRPDDARPYFLDALARNPSLLSARRNLASCP